MSRSISANVRAYRILASIVALALAFGYMASAHAQTPDEAQYGSPTETAAGNPAASGKAASPDEAVPDSEEAAASEVSPPVKTAPDSEEAAAPKASTSSAPVKSGKASASKTSASTGAKDKGGSAKVLPATGGQSLPLIVLGTVALGAVGLLAVRRADRR